MRIPKPIAAFLEGKRFAVAGVSREGKLPANAIFRKLKAAGYDAVPVNPNAATVEGVPCYPNLAAIPGPLDGVVIAAHPDVAAGLVSRRPRAASSTCGSTARSGAGASRRRRSTPAAKPGSRPSWAAAR